ncbi:uncharacterized protein LOC125758313 [Rhipicephalus sanguineus]|uniref:uncharacterized protein LOC125758313 n=1 Tax=Rhipicephalus sanguineus TaxID=34632 RepID=UPI0020C43805|nr:uncharacterized protein LOC125758313 [Rhipicephalus sanguineus]
MTGEALTVIGRLDTTAALNYDQLRAALLQRFRYTAEGYREKFRKAKPEENETGLQYAARLSGYFDRWLEMGKTETCFCTDSGKGNFISGTQKVPGDLAAFQTSSKGKKSSEFLHGNALEESAEPDKELEKAKKPQKGYYGKKMRKRKLVPGDQLAPDRTIVSSKCSCKAGCLGKCKHAAAVVLWLNEERSSCTDLPQAWGHPAQKPNIDAKESIEELFGRNTEVFIGGRKPDRIPPSHSLNFRRKTEAIARASFEQKIGQSVLQVGLIVHLTQPWLCASPDGLFKVGDNTALLEIKCPYSRKDDIIIDAEREISFVKYIVYEGGQLKLRKRHPYYTQIQLSMYVTNTHECFFFVYTNKHSVTTVVPRDDGFLSEAVPKMEYFYFNYYLKHLV